MTVKVESLQMQIGGATVSQFNLWTDNFGASGQTITDVRKNYYFLVNGEAGNNASPCDNVPAVSGTSFQFSGNGSAQALSGHWIPNGVPLAKNVSQFAEAIINTTAGAYRGGFGCFMTGDHRGGVGFNQGYMALFLPDTSQIAITSLLNNTRTTLGALGTMPANGSKVAFTAEILGNGDVKLQIWDDEVSILSFTDSVAPIYITGLPSMFTRNCVVGQTCNYDNLRIGVLSRLGYYA